MDFDKLKNLFIKEVNEIIAKTEALLLDLERDQDNIDIITEIYRHMHTIKGAAGMYGLNLTVRIAHLFEDVYKKIKNSEISVNKDIINLSFKALDYLKVLIKSDEADVSQKEIENLKNDLRRVIDIKEEQPPVPSAPEAKQLMTYYILFQPNADIYERGIRLTGIIEDLEALENKIISPFSDDTREQQGKLALFWQIIAVSDDRKKLENIFIFVPDEVEIIPLCEGNALENPEFVDFYNNLIASGYSSDHKDKLLSFCRASQGEAKPQQSDENSSEQRKQTRAVQTESFEGIDSVRVESKQLDNLLNLVSELIIGNSRLNEAVKNNDFQLIKEISEKLFTTTNLLKEQTLRLRLVPIKILFDAFRRTVRELAQIQGKKIVFATEGGDTLIDKTIIERLYTPLLHIIRNAIDHGIEPPDERVKLGKSEEGLIRLIAFQTNVNIFIQIQDDGRGLDPDKIKAKAIELGLIKPGQPLTSEEVYELIFMPEFSTAGKITELSGRGMGMDIIRKSIRQLRGNVEIESEKGLGMSVTLKLPSTLSIIETLRVSTNGVNFLIPLSNILTTEKINPFELNLVSGSYLPFRGELLPLINAREFFDLGGDQKKNEKLIVINLGTRKYAMIFEQIHDEVSAVVKNLGKLLQGLDYFIGASILGDGSIAYIIDPYKIVRDLNFVLKT